jgi:hypothetical protein
MGNKGKVSSSYECAYNRVLRFADDAQRKREDQDDLRKTRQAAPAAIREEEDPDSDGDEFAVEVVSKKQSLQPGDYEVEGLDGSITT